MKKILLAVTAMGIIAMAPTQQASAHVVYLELINNPVYDDPTNDIGAIKTINGDATTYHMDQAGYVQSNYGWADAADGNWGDSHAGAWDKFEITDSAGAYIDLSVFRNNDPFGIADLTPALTLYKGLLPVEAHDGDSVVPPGFGGAWNALGDTTMGNSLGEVATINYIAHAGEGNTTDSVTLSHIWLDSGVYTVALGGTCATCNDPTDIHKFDARGYGVNLTVTAVPVPAAVWLMMGGLMSLLGLQKRKMAA